MEHHFWHDKWARGDIGFHEADANPLLVQHFDALGLAPGSRVFLPLCGKTRDIAWLLEKGYRVAGAELSQVAIDQLFAELGVVPQVATEGQSLHYRAPDIDIHVGDIFELTRANLGSVDAVYDRAALVALPEALRTRYAAHLMQLTGTAPQLLICFEYDQAALAGPPFSIPDAEVQQHYDRAYALHCLSSSALPGGLKGKCPAMEKVWLLKAR
jgi:thiopurine S-methyltransferase